MNYIQEAKERLLFPHKIPPVVDLEGNEYLYITFDKLQQELELAYKKGQEKTLKDLKKLRSKKFPRGEREWCLQCVTRLSKDLQYKLTK